MHENKAFDLGCISFILKKMEKIVVWPISIASHVF